MQEILLNNESKETRYAVLKNGTLYDLIVERKKNRQLAGNVYRGRVTNILHNIQSAFIDINEGENGFIHISDILEMTVSEAAEFLYKTTDYWYPEHERSVGWNDPAVGIQWPLPSGVNPNMNAKDSAGLLWDAAPKF